MKIETANGTQMQNVDETDLIKQLKSLSDDNNFLILSDGENYIQCALLDTGFIAEYQDPTGHYEADSIVSGDTIEKMFTAYLGSTADWKTMTAWSYAQGGGASAPVNEEKSSRGSIKQNLSPENLLNSVKNQVSREVSRGISRKTSGFIGRIIRKFLG